MVRTSGSSPVWFNRINPHQPDASIAPVKKRLQATPRTLGDYADAPILVIAHVAGQPQQSRPLAQQVA